MYTRVCIYLYVHIQTCTHTGCVVLRLVARLYLTLCDPMSVAHQAPLSMGLSSQEYWSGLPCPPPGHLPNPEIDPGFLHCRWILYRLSHQGSPRILEWAHTHTRHT